MSLTGLIAIALALGAATTAAYLLRRPRLAPPDTRGEPATALLTPDELGQRHGERATLVQFSAAFCQPCRATRQLLQQMADTVDGVQYVEIDADANLELVRRLGIVRVPTVLILDGRGRLIRRGSGQPRKADVIAAIGVAVTPEDAPIQRSRPQ